MKEAVMAIWKKRGPMLGLVVVCLTAAVYATGMPLDEAQRPLPAGIVDLATATRVEVAENNTVVLSGQFGGEIDDDDEVKREAVLTATGGSTAKGEAEIELDTADRSKQELEVEVEGLTARATYQVMVDGQVAGTMTTDARGKGNLELARGTNQK
jgi:hypothetical protein